MVPGETRWFFTAGGVKWTSYIARPEGGDGRPYLRFDSGTESRRGSDDPAVLEAWRTCSALELEWMCDAAEPMR